MKPINLAIADDETLFRAGMKLMISSFEGLEVVFEASNGQALLDYLESTPITIDMVLLDLKMPILNGVETAKILEKTYPDLKVIIVSSYFSKVFVFNMIQLGAASYLPKNSIPEEVEHALRSVANKGFYYSDEVMQIIKASIMEKNKPAKLLFEVDITPREQEVLQLICEQNTNIEIAKQLFISARTVDGHRTNLLQKLNCRNTAGLVALAVQQQLVQIDPSKFWN